MSNNFDYLLKLMNMTTSSNDHEALVAIRKANERLRALGLTWSNVLGNIDRTAETLQKFGKVVDLDRDAGRGTSRRARDNQRPR